MTDLLNRHSFVELGARQRAKALLDAGSYRELIDPFQRVMSPWLTGCWKGLLPLSIANILVTAAVVLMLAARNG